jgi:hypothetical protein
MEFKGVDDRPVQIRCSVQRCATGGLEETENIIGATFEELLTKELERPKAEPKPEAPPAEVAAQPVTEAAAVATVQATDPATAQAAVPAANENAPAAPLPAAPADAAPAAPAASATAAAAAAPGAPAAPAAAKPKSSLFSGAAIPTPKKTADDFPSEDEIGAPKAAAKPAPPPEDAGPVFRDVPLPDPAPVAKSASSFASSSSDDSSHDDSGSDDSESDDSDSHDSESSETTSVTDSIRLPVGGSGKTQVVLTRVKELLVKQEQTIKKQAAQLKKQRDSASKEVEKLRHDVAEMKQQMAELRSRTQADDDAISDLATFLDQHGGAEGGGGNRESEAA